MLDLELSLKYDAISDSDLISHKIYQKPFDIYQYKPTQSEHKVSLFFTIIITILYCNNTIQLAQILQKFMISATPYTKELIQKKYISMLYQKFRH